MNTTRYKFLLSYDGSRFAGFQVQSNQRTVQGEIEKALKKMSKGAFVRIHGAGRTDAGVHALGQVIHFDYPNFLPAEAMQRALNTLVTEEIAFFDGEIVDEEFHSRYCAKSKTYQYIVYNRELRDPFKWNYTTHHPYPMDRKRTEEALAVIEGTHDFTSFSSAKTHVTNKIRTIYEASLKVDEEKSEWIFTFRGNGFLYHMIRIIMGTILPIADGRKPVSDMAQILEVKNRQAGGMTGSPKGLCLMEVSYSEKERNVSNVE